jgi:hypothetical protein
MNGELRAHCVCPPQSYDGASVPGWVCDGEWHRGWSGHDPYATRCPKAQATALTEAHGVYEDDEHDDKLIIATPSEIEATLTDTNRRALTPAPSDQGGAQPAAWHDFDSYPRDGDEFIAWGAEVGFDSVIFDDDGRVSSKEGSWSRPPVCYTKWTRLPRPDAHPSPEQAGEPSDRAKLIAYQDAHDVAVELGYASLTEALEALSDLKAEQALDWCLDMDAAPRDRMIIAMARYPEASAGGPCFVAWTDKEGWCEFSRRAPEPMVCWAWIDREALGDWPQEDARLSKGAKDV